jgi:uncharacterized protein
MRSLTLPLVLALGTLAGCSAPAAGPAAPTPPSITAHGLGTVTGTPDTLRVTLGVQTQGASAKAALDDNSGKATALIDLLKSGGVAPADIQTSQLSINPTFTPNGRISGYEVTNMVTATIHDVAAAGGLIDAAGHAAGDAVRVQQIGFLIDDDSALRATARADAVRQAQAQAKQMAEAAGVRLGPIRSITESPQGQPSPMYPEPSAALDRAAAVPIQPGRQELRITVDVVYDINQ